MEVFRQIGWLIRKDLALQFRTKDMLALIIVFSVLVVLIFCFAFGPIFPEKLEERGKLAASVLWATFLFAGIITLNRSFDIERANGALHGLRLTGVDASCLYLSKVVSIFVFLILLEVVVTPIVLQFLDVITVLPVALQEQLPWLLLKLIGVLAIGTLGFLCGRCYRIGHLHPYTRKGKSTLRDPTAADLPGDYGGSEMYRFPADNRWAWGKLLDFSFGCLQSCIPSKLISPLRVCC